MIFFPNCKINIGLNVLRRRGDGFHDIETVMVPVEGLCDVLEIVPAEGGGVTFRQSGLGVGCPEEQNLCVRAYRLMAGRYGIGGVAMHLHKVVPSGAGLGGGSSDAAFTIKGLNKIFSLGLSTEQMELLAAELGSDTAFFIRNEPQLAQGRGEMLSPYPVSLAGKRLLIVKPGVSIPTAEAYSGVSPGVPARRLTELLGEDIRAWRHTVANDFEPHIFAMHPELGEIKECLYNKGALYASMSGSGSAVYAIFDDAGGRECLLGDARTCEISAGLRKNFGELFVYQQLI